MPRIAALHRPTNYRPLALAARDFSGKRFKAMGPEAPELVEPGVDLAQRARVYRVDAPRPVGAHGGEAALAQHLQVRRHRGLRDPELPLDDGDDITRAVLAAGEQLQDAAPDRIAQNVEGMHQPSLVGSGSPV